MSSSTAWPPPSSPSRGPGLSATIPVAVGLGAFAGGVGYAIMRYSYQRFYNEFGLTPDDVGPSSAAALTQSGVGVAAFVALFALLPLTLALLVSAGCGRALRCDYSRRSGRWRDIVLAIPLGHSLQPESASTLNWSRVALDLCVRIGAADLTFLGFVRATSGHWEHLQLVVLTIAVVLLTSRRYAEQLQPAPTMEPRGPPEEQLQPASTVDPRGTLAEQRQSAQTVEPLGTTAPQAMLALARRLPGQPWIVAALVVVVGVTVLASSLPIDAERTALCTISHPNLRVRYVHTHRTFPGLGHISVLRVRADPAAAIPTSAAPLGQLSKARPHYPFIYLGDAAGHDFLYTVNACQTLQIPDTTVVVLTSPRATSCHWWNQSSVLRHCGKRGGASS